MMPSTPRCDLSEFRASGRSVTLRPCDAVGVVKSVRAEYDLHGHRLVAANVTVPDIQRCIRKLFESDGALRWLSHPTVDEVDTAEPRDQLRSAAADLEKGKLQSFFAKVSRIPLGWFGRRGLQEAPVVVSPSSAPPQSGSGTTSDGAVPKASHSGFDINTFLFGRGAIREPCTPKDTLIYLAEAICPWDYDRKEPSLTFVNVWTDIESDQSNLHSVRVKLASTIKPLHQEWKATARARLLSLGPGGVVFGKAGAYLIGDKEPYIGLEADRVVDISRFKNTKLFLNANYRSSRKSDEDSVVASAGIQQTVNLGDGLEVTFRVGLNTKNGLSRPFFAPVPYGSYF